MKNHVAAVVERFKRLTSQEKVQAYIEIDEVWKALNDGRQEGGRKVDEPHPID